MAQSAPHYLIRQTRSKREYSGTAKVPEKYLINVAHNELAFMIQDAIERAEADDIDCDYADQNASPDSRLIPSLPATPRLVQSTPPSPLSSPQSLSILGLPSSPSAPPFLYPSDTTPAPTLSPLSTHSLPLSTFSSPGPAFSAIGSPPLRSTLSSPGCGPPSTFSSPLLMNPISLPQSPLITSMTGPPPPLPLNLDSPGLASSSQHLGKRPRTEEEQDNKTLGSAKRHCGDIIEAQPSRTKKRNDRRHLYMKKKKQAYWETHGFAVTERVRNMVGQKVEELPISCQITSDLHAQLGGYRMKARKLSAKMKAFKSEQIKHSQSEPEAVLRNLLDDPEEPYKLIEWDGIKPVMLVDDSDTVIGALAGQPDHDSYRAECEKLFGLMTNQAQLADFDSDNLSHRRGPYPTMDVGITYAPTRNPDIHNLKLSELEKKLDAEFRKQGSEDIIQGFVESCFDLYAHGVFNYYKDHMDRLRQNPKYHRLIHNNAHGVYPGKSRNWPPGVFTWPHCDVMNLAFGWCAIVALGRFQPHRSGHLVIHNLRLVVQFPPGACILIPSAFLWHSNIPIHRDDERASLTFYAPNGLFRFIDNDFMTEKQLKENNKQLWRLNEAEKPLRLMNTESDEYEALAGFNPVLPTLYEEGPQATHSEVPSPEPQVIKKRVSLGSLPAVQQVIGDPRPENTQQRNNQQPPHLLHSDRPPDPRSSDTYHLRPPTVHLTAPPTNFSQSYIPLSTTDQSANVHPTLPLHYPPNQPTYHQYSFYNPSHYHSPYYQQPYPPPYPPYFPASYPPYSPYQLYPPPP
ncbi:hypothetical protein NP233_g4244 [Leucocoprinus birnbaumii]|uniref:Uncharacterized protein n=1 Tax=Leucocoprinus birnbaumii TaxID=56174 RepID=A0AAD5YXD2_9AGAR|nr:hypothetical protein NP233_g4244 [Leucocoprinus birnbaumii]